MALYLTFEHVFDLINEQVPGASTSFRIWPLKTKLIIIYIRVLRENVARLK